MTIGKRGLRRITAFSLLSACTLSIAPVWAQSQDADDVDDAMIEEVIVTGSRIPRAGFDTLQPAIVVDSEFIDAGGFTDIATALNQIPAFGVPGNSTEGGQGASTVGQNFVNFFGLGSQRTLTLVNGHRFVSSNTPALTSGANAGLQVDLNVIPATLIERVETIAIGGAPIYGADAIAGTVNIIMKDDFEGFNVTTSYGVSSQSDMEETEIGVAWGANTADGRGNVVIGVEYTDRKGMIESDRDHHRAGWQFREPADPNNPFTRILVADAHANIVSADGVITPGAQLLPNFGVGAFDGQYLQFSPDGSLRPYDVGSPTGNAVWSLGGDGLFLPDVTALFTPIERTLATAFAHYEIAEGVEAFGEVWLAHVEATEAANQAAYQSGFFGQESHSLEFAIDHPLLTPSAQATLAGLTDGGVPITTFHIQRSSEDLRPNNNANDSEMNMHRIVGGLRGDFEVGSRFFNWDVSYNFGQSTADTTALDVVSERMMYALDVIPDPVTGELGCRVVVDPTSRPPDPGAPFGTSLQAARYDNCVPLDIFGNGRPSQEALEYITVNQVNKTVMTQQVVSANIGGDLFELPAGSFGAAIGISHREEKGDFQAGGFAALGLGRSVPVESVFGEYESDEIYVEFYAPLISPDMDIPLVASLSVEGAYRRLDNSLAGEDDVYTIGGRWAPIDDIEIRGNMTRSIRAPAITELFLPLSGTFSFASDPCDARFVDNGPNPTARRANCISGGGALPPIPDPDNFVSNVANASVEGVTGGNIGLLNEAADAWTVGAVFRPRFAEGLQFAIDYVDFDIQDAITEFTLTQIMESCYDQDTFPNTFCSAFSRQPNGQLPPNGAFQSGYVNAGERTFKGMTMEFLYSTDLWAGQFDFTASVMNIQEDITRIKESVQDDGGEVGQSDWQGQLNFRYSQNQWAAFLQARMIGKGVWSNDDVPMARDVMGEGDVWIFSGSFNYDINDMFGLQLTINNIFDELPSPGAVASGNDAVYGNLGRFYRFGVNVAL